jgi:(2Fe-2S) ferredoxin
LEEIPLPYETVFLVCTNRRPDDRPACGPAGGDALLELLKRLVKERRTALSPTGPAPGPGGSPPTEPSPPTEGLPPTGAPPPTEPRRARVSATGCLGCCADGPTVVVFPGGVRYARVREEDLPGILERHLPEEA